MNLDQLNKLALEDDKSCEIEEEEDDPADVASLSENLCDALTLLEDTEDFLEVMIADSPKFVTNYFQKQMVKLKEEISDFLADYIWNDGQHRRVGKNCIDDGSFKSEVD